MQRASSGGLELRRTLGPALGVPIKGQLKPATAASYCQHPACRRCQALEWQRPNASSLQPAVWRCHCHTCRTCCPNISYLG